MTWCLLSHIVYGSLSRIHAGAIDPKKIIHANLLRTHCRKQRQTGAEINFFRKKRNSHGHTLRQSTQAHIQNTNASREIQSIWESIPTANVAHSEHIQRIRPLYIVQCTYSRQFCKQQLNQFHSTNFTIRTSTVRKGKWLYEWFLLSPIPFSLNMRKQYSLHNYVASSPFIVVTNEDDDQYLIVILHDILQISRIRASPVAKCNGDNATNSALYR